MLYHPIKRAFSFPYRTMCYELQPREEKRNHSYLSVSCCVELSGYRSTLLNRCFLVVAARILFFQPVSHDRRRRRESDDWSRHAFTH